MNYQSSAMNLMKFQVIKLIHRNLLYFYTLTMKDQRQKFKKQFHLLSFFASQRIKCLGINLPKETKDLCSENHKMLMKEIKEDINR